MALLWIAGNGKQNWILGSDSAIESGSRRPWSGDGGSFGAPGGAVKRKARDETAAHRAKTAPEPAAGSANPADPDLRIRPHRAP